MVCVFYGEQLQADSATATRRVKKKLYVNFLYIWLFNLFSWFMACVYFWMYFVYFLSYFVAYSV